MHRFGVRKHDGHSVRSLTQAIFTLPFLGKNFFRGIVHNQDIGFKKNAAYQLLRGTNFNWRRFLLCMGLKLFKLFDRLTSEQRESADVLNKFIQTVVH
jgi:hypothetical protein